MADALKTAVGEDGVRGKEGGARQMLEEDGKSPLVQSCSLLGSDVTSVTESSL